MGGTLDGVRMTVAGALHWEVGEEILVFLEASERDFRVAGFTQGKFVLERDPVTRRVYATREALGATQFVQRPGGPVIDDAGRAVKVPVDQLLAEALPQIQEGN